MCRFEKKISENELRQEVIICSVTYYDKLIITEFEIFRITKIAEHLNHFKSDSKSKNS